MEGDDNIVVNDEEFGYVHINTGGKELTEDEVEEVKEWFRSIDFEVMTRKAEESRRRVEKSKITDRTVM
ncbi:hypothetical protein [Staphylococcus gallinarum]|uniref:hypothetical protein n=1 Tax=Staphylococcus gallinarum TaxID=1293 RepID=UPI002DBD6105|nr:hypothetical protein [Staphylococcus gallinarum]MEB6277536.1 hypothetical protein [Staphylococcus gallinarum]